MSVPSLGTRIPSWQLSLALHTAVWGALYCAAILHAPARAKPHLSHGFLVSVVQLDLPEDDWQGQTPDPLLDDEEGEDEVNLEADHATGVDSTDDIAGDESGALAADPEPPVNDVTQEAGDPVTPEPPTRLGFKRRASTADGRHAHGWRDTGDTVRCVRCSRYYPTAKQCTDEGCGVVAYPFHDCPATRRR